MRWTLFLSLPTVFCLSCTDEDPAPLFVDVAYQVRCVSCEPVSPDNDPHEVTLLDGEEGFTVRCRVSHRDGDRVLTFSSAFIDEERPSDNYSLEIQDANMDSNHRGDDCQVSISEGSNEYLGTCTSGVPDEDDRCSLKFAVEGDIVTGSLLCVDVENRVNTSTTRHVVRPGTTDEAADFEIHGCVGL